MQPPAPRSPHNAARIESPPRSSPPCYTPRTVAAGHGAGEAVETTLFFGDNLSVLKGHDGQGQPYFPDACVDLIYLDPPFNSNRSYNVLFKDEHGAQPPAQIKAFDDTWNYASARPILDATLADPATPYRVVQMLQTLHDLLGSEMMAYLTLEPPTKEMRNEAAAGAYTVAFTGEQVPMIRILTIADLLAGKSVDRPKAGTISTLKQAQRAKTPAPTQFALGDRPPPSPPVSGGGQ